MQPSEENGNRPTPYKPVGFVTPQELAEAYGVSVATLKKELDRIPKLELRQYQRFYSLVEQKIIFTHLGNPFET